MNNDFTELTQSYLGISNLLEHKIELIKKDPVLANEVIKCQATINDLIIQFQNIKFKIETIEPETEENNQPSETDKFINKTIQDMLPIIMLHMMNTDPNSILNKPTMQSDTQTKNNTTLNANTISKMLSLATTLMNLPTTPTTTTTTSNITVITSEMGSNTVSNSVDDVD